MTTITDEPGVPDILVQEFDDLSEDLQYVTLQQMANDWVRYKLNLQTSLAIDPERANMLFEGSVYVLGDGAPYVLKGMPTVRLVYTI
jgi:hypothetical protein